MRIGIITWYSGTNPGTFLQLYGLYTYCLNSGHQPKIIKYKNNPNDLLPKGIYYYVSQLPYILISKIQNKRMRNGITRAEQKYKKQISIRQDRFNLCYANLQFTKEIRTTDDFVKLNNEFDAFIVGSDQIWNPSMLNSRYFLDFVNANKLKISYSTSAGTSKVLPKQKLFYKKYLSSFNYISVREKSLKIILEDLLHKDVFHVLDPSMLIDKTEYLSWARFPSEIKVEKYKYLLCYFMPRNKIQDKIIKEYAEKHNLKIIVIPMIQREYNVENSIIYPEIGPKEFLGLIANSHTVFTSSFHCTIFSILFNRELFVFENHHIGKTANISQRYIEQLNTFGMSHRLIKWKEDLKDYNLTPIDYNKVNKIFEERKEFSKQFLMRAINK